MPSGAIYSSSFSDYRKKRWSNQTFEKIMVDGVFRVGSTAYEVIDYA